MFTCSADLCSILLDNPYTLQTRSWIYPQPSPRNGQQYRTIHTVQYSLVHSRQVVRSAFNLYPEVQYSTVQYRQVVRYTLTFTKIQYRQVFRSSTFNLYLDKVQYTLDT